MRLVVSRRGSERFMKPFCLVDVKETIWLVCVLVLVLAVAQVLAGPTPSTTKSPGTPAKRTSSPAGGTSKGSSTTPKTKATTARKIFTAWRTATATKKATPDTTTDAATANNQTLANSKLILALLGAAQQQPQNGSSSFTVQLAQALAAMGSEAPNVSLQSLIMPALMPQHPTKEPESAHYWTFLEKSSTVDATTPTTTTTKKPTNTLINMEKLSLGGENGSSPMLAAVLPTGLQNYVLVVKAMPLDQAQEDLKMGLQNGTVAPLSNITVTMKPRTTTSEPNGGVVKATPPTSGMVLTRAPFMLSAEDTNGFWNWVDGLHVGTPKRQQPARVSGKDETAMVRSHPVFLPPQAHHQALFAVKPNRHMERVSKVEEAALASGGAMESGRGFSTIGTSSTEVDPSLYITDASKTKKVLRGDLIEAAIEQLMAPKPEKPAEEVLQKPASAEIKQGVDQTALDQAIASTFKALSGLPGFANRSSAQIETPPTHHTSTSTSTTLRPEPEPTKPPPVIPETNSAPKIQETIAPVVDQDSVMEAFKLLEDKAKGAGSSTVSHWNSGLAEIRDRLFSTISHPLEEDYAKELTTATAPPTTTTGAPTPDISQKRLKMFADVLESFKNLSKPGESDNHQAPSSEKPGGSSGQEGGNQDIPYLAKKLYRKEAAGEDIEQAVGPPRNGSDTITSASQSTKGNKKKTDHFGGQGGFYTAGPSLSDSFLRSAIKETASPQIGIPWIPQANTTPQGTKATKIELPD